MIAAICLAAASISAEPGGAWYWPIFGFGPGPCPPPASGVVPSPILPGTFEWATQITGPARLIQPGYAYGLDAFHGSITLGLMPSFNFPGIDVIGK